MAVLRLPARSAVKPADTWDLSALCQTDGEWDELFKKLDKRIAGFDISKNPGITATLYNLGDAATRARELRAVNDARAKKGQPPLYPQENFYGWLINDREADLRKLL